MAHTTTLYGRRMPVDRLVVDDVPRGTSTFVNGYYPRQRGRVVVLGILGAVVLTAASSADAVHSAGAGTIAALGAVGPLLGRATGRWAPLRHTLRPLARLSIGLVGVCAVYGASVALAGAPGSAPAAVVAALSGLAMCYLGLAALGVVRDPFAGWTRHFPDGPMVVVGSLVGALQIGVAPAPPGVAGSGNPLYGAAAVAARSAGTLVIVAAVFLALSYAARGRLRRWLADGPRRTTVVVAAGLVVAGAFTILHGGGQPLIPGLLIP